MKGRTFLFLIVAMGLSAVLWREYPAMVRYLKIKRM